MATIGIFDSGIGGLTVYSEVRKALPGHSIIYLGDTARLPYGTKSRATVTNYARSAANFLLKHDVQLIVTACNTASALALDQLTDELPVPIIGVVRPGAAEAVRQAAGGAIAIIGTSSTIGSGAYPREIEALSPGAETFTRACPLFVPLVEEGWTDGEAPRLIAATYLAELRQKKPAALVLGCTHYPMLKKVIAETMGPMVKLIDSAAATAAEVVIISQELEFEESEKDDIFFATDLSDHFRKVASIFLGSDTNFELVDL